MRAVLPSLPARVCDNPALAMSHFSCVLGRLLILPIGQGASIVSALGLSWQHNPTVFSYKEYEDYGSTLGTNATHAAQLRAGVIKGKMESPLFDTEGWARDYVRVLKQAAATAASAAAAAAQK